MLTYHASTGKWLAAPPALGSSFNIRRQQFTATGSSASFVLTQTPTSKNYLIVTVSGIPQTAASLTLTGSTVTLGGAPNSGEIVEVLDFSEGVQPTIQDSDDVVEGVGNLYYTDARVKALLGNLDSNIIPSATNTYDLGSSTKTWKDLYLAGNTIYLGSAKMKYLTSTGILQFLDASDNPITIAATISSDTTVDGGTF